MKVILLKDVKNIGRQNEIKDFSPGYVKNFLLPKGLALLATSEALRIVSKKHQDSKKEIEILENKLKELQKVGLSFKVKTGPKGEIYDSITSRDVEEALEEKGFLDAKAELDKSIKNLGEAEVVIHIGRGVTGKVKLLVEPLPQ